MPWETSIDRKHKKETAEEQVASRGVEPVQSTNVTIALLQQESVFLQWWVAGEQKARIGLAQRCRGSSLFETAVPIFFVLRLRGGSTKNSELPGSSVLQTAIHAFLATWLSFKIARATLFISYVRYLLEFFCRF